MKIIRIIISWGGFGDAVLVTPALRAIKKKKPGSYLIVYCPHKQIALFKRNPNIDLLIPLYFFNKPVFSPAYIFFPKFFRDNNLSRYPLEKVTTVSVRTTLGAFLGVRVTNEPLEISLSAKEDAWAVRLLSGYSQKKKVVIHITSDHSPNSHWKLERWNQLVAAHPDIDFIQLGLAKEEGVTNAIDLRGKTTLRQALSIIKHADSFVGIESFFAHVTNAFQKRGVVLFMDATPMLWGHQNNINMYKKLSCSPCFVTLDGYKCPYGQECAEHTVAEVSAALIRQLQVPQP
ncbi:glycosyltransferase family 9 protein [Chitinophaga sp. GbtcB8]|uniref:glycosyltransferase family 9 protein n=1 Tax=Chitinophaga sp. GbtcB8 TaxID=2824753 RepID=UPI001C30E679|nr:glycosyltransferase family 9 protein [Chitinophaga sp. GbtcB8]